MPQQQKFVLAIPAILSSPSRKSLLCAVLLLTCGLCSFHKKHTSEKLQKRCFKPKCSQPSFLIARCCKILFWLATTTTVICVRLHSASRGNCINAAVTGSWRKGQHIQRQFKVLLHVSGYCSTALHNNCRERPCRAFPAVWWVSELPRQRLKLLCVELLRSEKSTGKRAKLHTVAASNYRDHTSCSLAPLLLVRATCI